MRTTLNIDALLLRELKQRQAAEGKSLGPPVSNLLARALKEEAGCPVPDPSSWIARPMGARVYLADKEAVYRALDR